MIWKGNALVQWSAVAVLKFLIIFWARDSAFSFCFGCCKLWSHGAFLFFHPSYSNGRKFSAQHPFCLSSGGVWVTLFTISVSHWPPQMTCPGLLSFSYTRMTFLQGMAREYMQIILFQTLVLTIFSGTFYLCTQASWKKNHKKSHIVFYHTQKHTHMHTSAVNRGCSDPDTVTCLPQC